MILGMLAVFAVGCACMSWRLGHHTQIREELEGSWLRSLVRDGTGSASLSDDDVPVEERVIIHFSTDCTSFQHWQALTLLDSAIRVGQRGAIVRMVSGCEKDASLTGEEQLTESQVRADHERFLRGGDAPFRFHLLFIDDMSTLSGSGARYKFATKCVLGGCARVAGLEYWSCILSIIHLLTRSLLYTTIRNDRPIVAQLDR